MKKGFVAACVLCLMLSGCGKKDNVSDDISEIQGTDVVTEEDDKTTEGSVGEENHEVNFDVTSSVAGHVMTANLTIDTRIPDKVTTVKVTPVVVDDDYLDTLSKKIFDDGEYEVLKVHYSAADSTFLMREMESACSMRSEEFQGVFQPSPYYAYLSELPETDIEQEETGIICEDTFETGDAMGSCHQAKAFIKGNIDGEPYILEYTKSKYTPNYDTYLDNEDIMIYPMNGRQAIAWIGNDAAAEAVYDNPEDTKVAYGDALATAESYVLKLGFDDYEFVTSFNMMFDSKSVGVVGFDGSVISGDVPNTPRDVLKGGYRFIFTPSYDGMKLSYCSGTERTTMEYDYDSVLENSWLQPAIQIDVDETGIRDICINSLYDMEEILSSDSKLITFDQANDIAMNMYKDTYEEDFEVGDIRLEYIIIQYKNETVMAPAWVYYRSMGPDVYGLKFAVNALDGSVVHFGYNGYGYVRWYR